MGDRKIGYEVIERLGYETALREYRNGSYKTVAVEFFGKDYHFSAALTGKKIMNREAFLAILSEIDMQTFTKRTRETLGTQ